MCKTKIIGILNVTPNSFSDGGRFFEAHDAITQAEKLIRDGADMLDVGAESTGPGSSSIPQEEEWNRLKGVLPKIVSIAHGENVEVSVDTRNAKTASLAIECGVDCINDVGSFLDPDMPSVLHGNDKKIMITHNFGIPVSRTYTVPPSMEKALEEIIEWLQERIDLLLSQGIDKRRIIVDPGVGFGKAAEYSWYVLKHVSRLKVLGLPVCIGHSRKSFLSQIEPELGSRDVPTAIISALLLQNEVDFVRVHDVAMNKTALEIAKLLHTK